MRKQPTAYVKIKPDEHKAAMFDFDSYWLECGVHNTNITYERASFLYICGKFNTLDWEVDNG